MRVALVALMSGTCLAAFFGGEMKRSFKKVYEEDDDEEGR